MSSSSSSSSPSSSPSSSSPSSSSSTPSSSSSSSSPSSSSSSSSSPSSSSSSSSSSSLFSTALASSSSGLLARFPLHPLDTCKAKLQIELQRNGKTAISFREVFKRTWQKEGIKGLYRGFTITALGSIPAGCLYFTSYEAFKEVFDSYGFAGHFISGLGAEIVSCVIWVPIDVIKERLQIQSSISDVRLRYANTLDAVRSIVRYEGFRGIYKGYGATIASFGPFSALYFMMYEQMRHMSQRILSRDDLPSAAFLVSGASAGAFASLITSPLDMAKLHMQVARRNSSLEAYHYPNVLHGMRSIARNQGICGLWRGALTRVAFHAPSTALTITLFEKLKILFRSVNDN